MTAIVDLRTHPDRDFPTVDVRSRPMIVTSTPAATYDGIRFIHGSLGSGYSLRRPVRVHVYREDDVFVTSLNLVPIVGYGPTVESSERDLRSEIVDYVSWPESSTGSLSPALTRELETLREIIQRTDG